MKPIAYHPQKMSCVIFYIEGGLCYDGEYTCMRINRETIPSNKYVYECRNNDEPVSDIPAYIENGKVYQNFTGTFVTDSPIEFSRTNSLCIKGFDVIFDS